jgi:hypothetical protein
MKTLIKIALLVIDIFISSIVILFGTGTINITDGEPTKSPLEVIVGLLVVAFLIILLLAGRTDKSAEKAYWYLAAGSPLLLLLVLFVY